MLHIYSKLKNKIKKIMSSNKKGYFFVSIGDFLLKRNELDYYQFIILSRILDIKNYFEHHDNTFFFQNLINDYFETKDFDKTKYNNNFEKLICSFRSFGYDLKSYVSINNELNIMDGTHRVGLAYFFDNCFIPVSLNIINRKVDSCLVFYKKGLPYNHLAKINNFYSEVEKHMVSTGNCFVCLICGFSDEENDNIINELNSFVKVCLKNKVNYKGSNSNFSRKLPFVGSLVAHKFTFTIVRFVNIISSEYVVNADGYYSKRVHDISITFNERHNRDKKKILYFSKNCYEGKLINDFFSNCAR